MHRRQRAVAAPERGSHRLDDDDVVLTEIGHGCSSEDRNRSRPNRSSDPSRRAGGARMVRANCCDRRVLRRVGARAPAARSKGQVSTDPSSTLAPSTTVAGPTVSTATTELSTTPLPCQPLPIPTTPVKSPAAATAVAAHEGLRAQRQLRRPRDLRLHGEGHRPAGLHAHLRHSAVRGRRLRHARSRLPGNAFVVVKVQPGYGFDFETGKQTYNGPKSVPVTNANHVQGDRRDRRLRGRAHVGDRHGHQAPVQRAGDGNAHAPARRHDRLKSRLGRSSVPTRSAAVEDDLAEGGVRLQ